MTNHRSGASRGRPADPIVRPLRVVSLWSVPRCLPAIALLLLLLPSGMSAVEDEAQPPAESPQGDAVTDVTASAPGTPNTVEDVWGAATVVGFEVPAGERRQLFLRASESFAGAGVQLPVLVLRGERPGPTVCLTAGIHGDELNGIEIVRAAFENTKPAELSGMLLGMPVVNLHGLRRSSRYLPDRRDLNRFFPGNPEGSSAARIAHAVFDALAASCHYLVDFHTGSFHRSNIPQIRADLAVEGLLELAQGFGPGIVIHTSGMAGTLRRSAVDAGIPAITYEAGQPMRFEREEIRRGVNGVRGLLRAVGALGGSRRRRGTPLVYYRSHWVRVNDGGIFLSRRELGDRVTEGSVLGTVTDPVTNERSNILTPYSGRIIGMALSQVVIPGFAAFHVGLEDQVPVKPLPEVPGLPPPESLDPDEQPE